MKTRMIALALFAATASYAAAQGAAPQATTVAQQSESFRDKLIRELKLTPEQVAKYDQIEATHRENAKELNRAGLDTPARQERARILRDDKEKQLKLMLTPEQYDKLVAMRNTKHDATQERRQQMQGGHQE